LSVAFGGAPPIGASARVREARLGVDVGGTFTDLVAVSDGRLVTAKVPSTTRDQSDAVMACVRAADVDPKRVSAFVHGTTVATNALLERKGARTALVTTEGFRDIIEIARQNRPALYDLTRDRPAAIVPRDLRFTVAERMGPAGPLRPLDDAALGTVVSAISRSDVESVAVCLLFSFLHPEHERRVGQALCNALEGTHVSLSSEVLPEVREYERFSTTVADAYLAPKLGDYLANLARRVTAAGMPPPFVMQSSGGSLGVEDARRRPAACVLSGPAGGVVGAAHIAGASGYGDVLSFDMGGTSTDVAVVVDGVVQGTTGSVVAGVPVRFPMVDVHTVSAGGGSIAWSDAGGALRVGPGSAGAVPGPAAYARGGGDPTVTDANLVLGYLADGARLGGEVTLHRGRSVEALTRLGESIGLDAMEAARGVVRVANAEMVRALRVVSVERGFDPREFALVAFGGAGPMHACALAEELEMPKVVVPRASGVLSALGLAISNLRRDYVRPWVGLLQDAHEERLEAVFADMEARAAQDLEECRCERYADLRYRGQSFELTVDAQRIRELTSRWHEAHEHRYGYRMESEDIELVALRVVATIPTAPPELRETEAAGPVSTRHRRASFDARWVDAPVLRRATMGRGSEVEGPAIVELDEATCVVRPWWSGGIDHVGNLVLERGRG
jgi:N-methylhydantoinase A